MALKRRRRNIISGIADAAYEVDYPAVLLLESLRNLLRPYGTVSLRRLSPKSMKRTL